jgi:dopamine beta-monooxygenase
MCVNYIHYYPKANLEVCKTVVANDSLNSFFNLMSQFVYETLFAPNFKISMPDQPISLRRRQPHSNAYKSINWTPYAVEALKRLYHHSRLNVECLQQDGKQFPVKQAFFS